MLQRVTFCRHAREERTNDGQTAQSSEQNMYIYIYILSKGNTPSIRTPGRQNLGFLAWH